ncbi:hypothetical protein CKA32_002685 [Geitlerinema sp. FC II]|uniref:FHA domain-containing protein n=1 Tax=Baaleninema simplex TaxID=2862350 RepID=UPI00034CA95B|nr:FHA domain-containing protein [Baaleninema simplex]PPT08523.1 hypothetical protein CKA32_002685 [Geitlerinema sp. FC II]
MLHPHQLLPLKRWTFDRETVVRVGRAPDNHVVLYSAVVSRHHLELRYEDRHWMMVNLGTNGTYLDDKLIATKQVEDGAIVRLARTGPKLQVHVTAPPPLSPAKQLLQILDKPMAEDEDPTEKCVHHKTRVLKDSPAKVPPENNK